jgi:hypothetical protein
MLSIFPPLLAFSGFSALLLRLMLGVVLVLWSQKEYKKSGIERSVCASVIQGILGVFLIIGFLTQVSAFFTSIFLGFKLFKKIQAKAFLTDGLNYYLILFIISVSLIFTGAGYIALDLPL